MRGIIDDYREDLVLIISDMLQIPIHHIDAEPGIEPGIIRWQGVLADSHLYQMPVLYCFSGEKAHPFDADAARKVSLREKPLDILFVMHDKFHATEEDEEELNSSLEKTEKFPLEQEKVSVDANTFRKKRV